MNHNNRRTLRNLAIFTVVVLSSGWLGYGLDRAMNNPPTQSLGMLLWLIAPLTTALLLRAFAGDGWKDFGLWPAFKGNLVWYAVSLLLFPAVAGLVMVIGGLFGLITLSNVSASQWLSIFALGLLPSFLKNLFEEFSWRGYLAPKINTLGLNTYAGHVLTGLVWSSWHLPYWLLFLGAAQVRAATGQDLAVFIPLAILTLVVSSVSYGEIRLATGSVWPAVVMHTMGNTLVDVLIAQNLIRVATGMEFAFSPLQGSILTLVFYLAAGIGLHQLRVRRQLS